MRRSRPPRSFIHLGRGGRSVRLSMRSAPSRRADPKRATRRLRSATRGRWAVIHPAAAHAAPAQCPARGRAPRFRAATRRVRSCGCRPAPLRASARRALRALSPSRPIRSRRRQPRRPRPLRREPPPSARCPSPPPPTAYRARHPRAPQPASLAHVGAHRPTRAALGRSGAIRALLRPRRVAVAAVAGRRWRRWRALLKNRGRRRRPSRRSPRISYGRARSGSRYWALSRRWQPPRGSGLQCSPHGR